MLSSIFFKNSMQFKNKQHFLSNEKLHFATKYQENNKNFEISCLFEIRNDFNKKPNKNEPKRLKSNI